MPITQLPTPPSRNDTINFATRADSFLAALPQFVSEANALQIATNTQTAANEAASQAAALASSKARDAAIAAWSASTAPTEQLSAISQSIHRGTIVKSIIYDTSKDSDGGAWRKRCTDKSWYNETLGGTGWIGQQASSATARAYLGSLASPELVTNGTFTTDTSGWTSSNATLSAVGGQLQVVGIGGTIYPKADLVLTLIVGRTYHVQFEITTASTQGITILGETLDPQTGAGFYYPNAIGTYTISFVATNATRTLSLVTNLANTSTGSFDNVSVKIVDPAISTVGYVYQSKSDNKFYRLETSGTTEVFRGLTREFPAVAAIVAENGTSGAIRVIVYDLTAQGCPMWAVISNKIPRYSASLLGSVAALNGRIVIGVSAGYGGLTRVDFVKGDIVSYTPGQGGGGTGIFTSAFSASDVGVFLASSTSTYRSYVPTTTYLINIAVNDVAITSLDSAPTDPATGLPVPTIVCQTEGGVSVIKDDGIVTSHAFTDSGDTIAVVGDTLRYSMAANMVGYRRISLNSLPTPTFSGTQFAPTAGAIGQVKVGVTDSEHVGTGTGTVGGIVIAKENPSTIGSQMMTSITNTYNSGWQVGDSRLATLAGTVAETITGSGEMVVNGTFSASSDWTLTGASITGGALVLDGVTNLLNGTVVATPAVVVPAVIGRSYVVSFDVTTNISLGSVSVSFGGALGTARSSVGSYRETLVAVSTNSINFQTRSVDGARTGAIDNISVKLAEPDRSVKNAGLVVNGTITKTAVASGAGLMAYSGFSASNYLEQPYNTNFDFGTGDFCAMGWVNITGVGSTRFLSRTDKTGATFGTNSSFALMLSSGNWHFQSVAGSWATGVAATTGLHFVVLTFSATSLKLYIDNVLIGSTTLALNITSTGSPVLMLGSGWYNGAIVDAVQGSMALWRISATAPSADQIAHIYRTELPLFQPNAQCTIAGTSTAVTALAYDDSAETLHVGTTWGRTSFKDLLRIDSEATSTGTITSLSASAGSVLTGGTTGARAYAPALELRDELRRKEIARKALGRVPAFFDYTATASQTAFVAPKGFTVKALYKNGTLMRETTTGTYWTRSNDGFQETATLSVGASVSDWISLMCIRA